MRAGAPSAPVLQQSRCCPTARFARGPHPALRAIFSHAARGRRGKLQFAALNLAPMPLTLPLLRNGLLPLPASRARGVWAVLGRDMAGQRCVNLTAAFAGMAEFARGTKLHADGSFSDFTVIGCIHFQDLSFPAHPEPHRDA